LPEVEGRGVDDSVALTGDGFAALLAWRNGTTIPPGENGGPRKTVLHLDRASVYAYETTPI